VHNHGPYGTNYSVSLFNGCPSAPIKVYMSEPTPLKQTYIVYDPQTSSFSSAPLPLNAKFASTAIAVDLNGDIVSGELAWTGRVIKSHPNGAIVWDTTTVSPTNTVISQDLRGIIIDEHN